MNPTPDPLDRLIRSACRSRPAPERPMPFRTEARVLAHWRTLRTRPSWFELVPLFRRGLVVACAAGALLVAFSLTQIQPSTPDAWAVANRVANTTSTP